MDPTVARIVLIVGRHQQDLYTQMHERYGNVARVIRDRRYGDRRGQVLPVGLERRRRTRREPWTAEVLRRWEVLGYRLLYRAEGVQADVTEKRPLE